MLSLIPLLYNRKSLTSEEDMIFKRIIELVKADNTLGKIFDSYEMKSPIRLPPLSELGRIETKSTLFQGILNFLSVILLQQTPYGDYISNTYTTRFMKELAERLRWNELDGRVLVLTDASLTSYRYFSGFQVFERIRGKWFAPNSVVVSITALNFNPLNIYKMSKHELGHSFELYNCNEECIMNHSLDLTHRPINYCRSCKKMIFENLGLT
jgi:hypothetical protein